MGTSVIVSTTENFYVGEGTSLVFRKVSPVGKGKDSILEAVRSFKKLFSIVGERPSPQEGRAGRVLRRPLGRVVGAERVNEENIPRRERFGRKGVGAFPPSVFDLMNLWGCLDRPG